MFNKQDTSYFLMKVNLRLFFMTDLNLRYAFELFK